MAPERDDERAGRVLSHLLEVGAVATEIDHHDVGVADGVCRAGGDRIGHDRSDAAAVHQVVDERDDVQ